MSEIDSTKLMNMVNEYYDRAKWVEAVLNEETNNGLSVWQYKKLFEIKNDEAARIKFINEFNSK